MISSIVSSTGYGTLHSHEIVHKITD